MSISTTNHSHSKSLSTRVSAIFKNKAGIRLSILLLTILISICLAYPAISGHSSVRRGSTFTSKSFQVTNIKSKRLEERESGSIQYEIEAKVRNRTNRPLTFTLGLQAIDRSGYKVDGVMFYKEYVKPRGTAYLTDTHYLDVDVYNDVWEWKVQTLKVY